MSSKYLNEVTQLIALVSYITSVIGLRCMTCDNDGLISSCLYKRTSICKDGVERCYLDVVVLESLQTVYNAGCRDEKVCQLVDRLGTRGSDVACVQCCNHNTTELEHPCNAFLCHKEPPVFPFIGRRNVPQ